MRAAIYHGGERGIAIEQMADPRPQPGELLIEVGFCGVCGSDVAMTSGSAFDYPAGRCFGHEYSGTVVEIGAGVSGWRLGDRVACRPKTACGACDLCREGHLLLCPGGAHLSKGFAQFVAVPVEAAVRLPQSLSLADGALVEPMACGLRAFRAAALRAGDRVLVLGAGSLALSSIWWARRLGAGRVVVAARSDHRRDICHDFGADAFVSLGDDDPDAITAALGGAPHMVVECVGKPGMIAKAVEQVRPGGTIVSLGMCMAPEPILPIGLTFKEARLVFPLGYSEAEFEETARAFDAANFKPEQMVSDVFALAAVGDVIARLRAGAALRKVHIDPRIAA